MCLAVNVKWTVQPHTIKRVTEVLLKVNLFFFVSGSSGWSFCCYSRSIWSIWRTEKFWKLCRCWEESWLRSNTTRIVSTCSAGTKCIRPHEHTHLLIILWLAVTAVNGSLWLAVCFKVSDVQSRWRSEGKGWMGGERSWITV